MARMVILILVLLVSVPSYAKNKVQTIRGALFMATETGSIGNNVDPSCLIDSRTPEGLKVLEKCPRYSECEVRALVDEKGNLIEVYSAREINTSIEPSEGVLLEAAAWASGIQYELETDVMVIWTMRILKLTKVVRCMERTFKLHFELTCAKNKKHERCGVGAVYVTKRGESWSYSK